MAILIKNVTFSEIAKMSQEEKDKCLNELSYAASNPSQDQIREQMESLNAQIMQFEKKYGFSSALMEEKVESGEMEETFDICSWLMILRKKTHIENRQSKASPQQI
jgi:hypothetical protein